MLKFSASNHRSVGRAVHSVELHEPTVLACAACGNEFKQFRKRPLPCCPHCEATSIAAWELNYVAPAAKKAYGAPSPRTKSPYARMIPKKPAATPLATVKAVSAPKAPVADPATQLRDLLAAQKALETLLNASRIDEAQGA